MELENISFVVEVLDWRASLLMEELSIVRRKRGGHFTTTVASMPAIPVFFRIREWL